MAATCEFGAILPALQVVSSAEEEVSLLEKLRDFLLPPGSAVITNDDDCEAQWLKQGLETQENPFPSKQPECLGAQDELNQFTFYLFERRFGWSEYLTFEDMGENTEGLDGRCSSASSLKVQEDTRYKGRLNELLDEYLRWYLAQNLNKRLLESLKYAVTQASSMPVVRNQTYVHVMHWLKHTSEHGFNDNVFPLVKTLIVSGITDVWSAIRNTCIARLAQSLDNFTLEQAHEFYTDLIRICQAKDTSWQAKEGAVMGMTTLVRRFSWTGVRSLDTSSSVQEDSSEYMLKFGECKQSTLPAFILDSVHSVLYTLLAHPQLSIRDQATKAFSSILSRCEFQEAFAAFEEVVNRLCKGTQGPGDHTSSSLPHLAVLRQDFKFLQAYEAEGLLGVCLFLIKHIPPGYLLSSWPLYFSTFNLYLMHPASTVRQATSAIFKILVAKDSSSPVLLKLVLQGLAADWQIDTELLTSNLTNESGQYITREGIAPTFKTSPMQERYRAVSSASASTPSPPPDVLSLSGDSERCGSPLVADAGESPHLGLNNNRRLSMSWNKYQRISIRCVNKLLADHPSTAPDLLISGTWEWREGRLLAYELIFKFLISNHIHYLFPTYSLPRTQSSASASVDENMIGSYTTNTHHHHHHAIRRQRSWTDAAILPSLTGIECINTVGIQAHIMNLRRSEFSPPSQHLKSNSSGAITVKDGVPVKEAWAKRPKRASSFSMSDNILSSTRKLFRQYSVSCQHGQPRRPFKPPKAQGSELVNSLLSQSKVVDKTEKNHSKTNMQSPINGLVQCLPSPIGKTTTFNGRCSHDGDDNVFHKTALASEFSETPQWAASMQLETLYSILYQNLLQTIESLADSRWELRRMGHQLLPLVTETLRWFNMMPLAYLWDNHLTRDNTLMCYGSCIALKHSISHAGRLLHFLNQPPSSWKDPESCGQAALNVVCEIKKGLKHWMKQVYGIIGYSGYDKLTVVAMETIMLSHICFSPSKVDKKQKCEAEERVLMIILHVFTCSFPEELLGISLCSLLHIEQSSFTTPIDGFLSCCPRSLTSEKLARQFGKYLISELHCILAKFLKTCEVHTVVVAFPVLVHYIGVFPEESKVCHDLVEGLQYTLSRAKEFTSSSEQRDELDPLIQTYFNFALVGISDVITTKTLDLSVVRQILDVFLKVCDFLDDPPLGHLFTAISTRLDYEPDLLRLAASEEGGSRTETPDLYMLSNDIPTSPVDEPPLPIEEDDEEPVDTTRMLPESVALDRSHESGRGTPHLPAGDDDASDGSDWDSWEDEDEDQTALIAVFADFLYNLQQLYDTRPNKGVSVFKVQLRNCGAMERRLVASVMDAHEPGQ